MVIHIFGVDWEVPEELPAAMQTLHPRDVHVPAGQRRAMIADAVMAFIAATS